MKQYTDKDQTAKLIELGFPEPKPSFYQNGATWIQCDGNYPIGELIEFLPKEITDEYDEVTSLEFHATEVYYTNLRAISYYVCDIELIDALFDMCVTLKEEGVI